jgi:integrase
VPKVASLRPRRLPSLIDDAAQWCVNVPAGLSPSGKRQRLFFGTKLEAETACELLKTRKVNFGHSLSSLSAARIAEASACYARLNALATPVTLTTAVTEFLALHHARTASVTMSSLWEKFLASKTSASTAYRQELASTFRRLESLSGMNASGVTAEQIEESLAGFPPAHRNAALRYLRAAFNFGLRAGWLQENPVKRLEFTRIVRDQVEVIAPATVEKLLFDSLTNDLELVPFLILSFYAGVRPDGELQKLLWSDLDLSAKEHHVTIRPTVAKKRRKRWIDLSPNALAWLDEYRARGGKMEGPLVPFSMSTLRRRRRRNARTAGLAEWPQQGARHTYCSCWLRQHGDINKLVLQAGHESPQVLWDHYYQAVSPEAAAAFWAIYPPSAGERRIITFPG